MSVCDTKPIYTHHFSNMHSKRWILNEHEMNICHSIVLGIKTCKCRIFLNCDYDPNSYTRRQALARVWIVPDSFNFLIMEFTVLLWTFNTRNCFISFPRSVPHNSISEFYGQFLGLHGRDYALTCPVNCGNIYRKVFLYQSCPINLIGHRWTPIKCHSSVS